MMRADTFCPGKLYSWMPTRRYVCYTYLLGALLLSAEALAEYAAGYMDLIGLDPTFPIASVSSFYCRFEQG